MLKSEGKSLRVYETNEDELNEELRETLYAEFREGNEDLAVGESGEVMFEVTADEYQTRTSKRDGKKKRVIFVATKDGTRFEQVLEDLMPRLDADTRTSVFMTDDSYGIRSNQTAGSVFIKYGNCLTIMTGVNLQKVSWHRRS